MELDRNGLEVLDRAEALQLLARGTIGRIGITADALPVVLPVNFLLHEEKILIQTSPGTKLDAATRNAVVAFEVDEFDPFDHSGWSVVITGVAREVHRRGRAVADPPTSPGTLGARGGRAHHRHLHRVRLGPSAVAVGYHALEVAVRLIDPRTGIEMLQRAECLRLLADDEVGRIAVIAGGAPLILPVNYALDGEAIVIRTAPGTKLDAGPRARACFEIDHFDRRTRTGWSVVAVGRLEEMSDYDTAAMARLRALPLLPWAAGDRSHWLRLEPSQITGRRIAG